MTMVCDRCGETFTFEEWNKWNKMNGKIEVRPIIDGEEASELAQAALKLRRALDGTNPTPKSVAECEANLIEEFADISNAINSLCEAWFGDDLDSECEFWDAELETEYSKYKRWLSLLEAKEQSDE